MRYSRYSEMKITLNPKAKDAATRDALVAEGGFGKYYTDHMVICQWDEKTGWAEPELIPYGPISLDPATAVFHYGQEIFEGMKAYRQPDGGIALFRPEANAKRFARSAARLALPEMPVELFMETVEALVKQDAGWVPNKVGESLYIRPFMIATEVGLGVRPSNKATYLLIATPAGAYFDPSKAVSVWISTEYVRASQGGTGEAKCGGNYAASLVAQKAAAKEGCDQVVWLDAVERKWVEEMGGMNLYFVKGKGTDAAIFTPKLTGTLLPGVTRDSILSVAADLGYKVEEGMISTSDWQAGIASGEITETFACGTAAVVSPIGQAKSTMGTWVTGDGQPGVITMQIRNHLLAIQHGNLEDKHGWVKRVL
jgi:branched-chain amino acid aminotransferase